MVPGGASGGGGRANPWDLLAIDFAVIKVVARRSIMFPPHPDPLPSREEGKEEIFRSNFLATILNKLTHSGACVKCWNRIIL
jgi:hypothetical protein